MIKRRLKERIQGRLGDGKAIIVVGPRQTGKSTLLKALFDESPSYCWLNGDSEQVRQLLEGVSLVTWKQILGGATTLIIDEAQRVPNIGLKVKMIVDELDDVKVVLSGSSSLELGNQFNEPLTGRKWEFHLLPFSFEELKDHHGLVEEVSTLEMRLIYGAYPDVVLSEDHRRETLETLADSYLFKDVFALENIKKHEKLHKLLQAIAFQVGNQVSYHELGKTVGLDNETVEKYIFLMERAFILFRLPSLSRNLRKELKSSRKIYFYDNGIRNAVIGQFAPLNLRSDVGALWENYMISERFKFNAYHQRRVNAFFWRTFDQQEIDYIEERDGVMDVFEFKWNEKRRARFSKTFLNAYPDHQLHTVNRSNYFEYLMEGRVSKKP